MADEAVSGKLARDFGDHIRENSYENGYLVEETDFSDPEEFVDLVTDEGLCHVLILLF